jgi:hypothetical protein
MISNIEFLNPITCFAKNDEAGRAPAGIFDLDLDDFRGKIEDMTAYQRGQLFHTFIQKIAEHREKTGKRPENDMLLKVYKFCIPNERDFHTLRNFFYGICGDDNQDNYRYYLRKGNRNDPDKTVIANKRDIDGNPRFISYADDPNDMNSKAFVELDLFDIVFCVRIDKSVKEFMGL